MIKENRVSKYLLYAIGEIVLVVIGILIALQINTWNQDQIQNREEQLALINLKQDFEYNKSQLDSLLILTKSKVELQFLLLNHTGNKPDPKTEGEFNTSLNASCSFTPYFPRNGYLDDLLFSGKLGLLKDQELRNRLSSWNPVFDDIKNAQRSVLLAVEKITEFFIDKGSWLNADAVGTTQTVKNNPFPASGFDIDNRILLDELEFENRIENVIYQNDKLMASHRKGLKLISKILESIEKDIKD